MRAKCWDRFERWIFSRSSFEIAILLRIHWNRVFALWCFWIWELLCFCSLCYANCKSLFFRIIIPSREAIGILQRDFSGCLVKNTKIQGERFLFLPSFKSLHMRFCHLGQHLKSPIVYWRFRRCIWNPNGWGSIRVLLKRLILFCPYLSPRMPSLVFSTGIGLFERIISEDFSLTCPAKQQAKISKLCFCSIFLNLHGTKGFKLNHDGNKTLHMVQLHCPSILKNLHNWAFRSFCCLCTESAFVNQKIQQMNHLIQRIIQCLKQ